MQIRGYFFFFFFLFMIIFLTVEDRDAWSNRCLFSFGLFWFVLLLLHIPWKVRYIRSFKDFKINLQFKRRHESDTTNENLFWAQGSVPIVGLFGGGESQWGPVSSPASCFAHSRTILSRLWPHTQFTTQRQRVNPEFPFFVMM